MKRLSSKFGITSVALMALLIAGCILSGTTVIVVMYTDLDLSTSLDFYYQAIDLTSESEWEDHKDNIKDIDQVGFELWMTNTSGVANTFYAYVDALSSSLNGSSTKAAVAAGATKILEIPIAATGQTFISYAGSFGHISNIETLKTLTESGQFKFFGMFNTPPSTVLTLDSVKVIVTFTAGL